MFLFAWLLLVEVGVGCFDFFLLCSCCVSLTICASMSSIGFHWSWLVRDFKFCRMGGVFLFKSAGSVFPVISELFCKDQTCSL